MKALKRAVLAVWMVERAIRLHIHVARAFYFKGGLLGRVVCALMDRWMLMVYGLDLYSPSIDIRMLSISHPGGILLGGNGIVSRGRVAVMAGVKFVARSPTDPEYLKRHAERKVFALGDNVIIGANSVVVGPVDICDNVIIGAMSLVNRSIAEPGVYVGIPVHRINDVADDEWVAHLPA